MKHDVEQALHALVGEPFTEAGRAYTVHWFHFGQDEHALHVQTTWRIVGSEGLIVGSDDLEFPAGSDPDVDPPDFDYHVQGSNRLDERLAAFNITLATTSVVVQAVSADHTGAFRLELSSGYALEVIPTHTLHYEYWRFFTCGADPTEPHFVVTGHGLES
jgi:hypothetical protein